MARRSVRVAIRALNTTLYSCRAAAAYSAPTRSVSIGCAIVNSTPNWRLRARRSNWAAVSAR